MKLSYQLTKLFLVSASLFSSFSYAGGILLYELGTDNNGLVNAGAAARAQGPATIASNPAGLNYLDGTQLTAAAQLLYGNISYDVDSNTNVAGGNSGNVLPLTPGAAFFVSKKMDEHWSVGFGSYGDFGLAMDFDNGWAGRYFVQDATLLGLSLVPSVAYRVNDQWSVGVGAKAMYGIMETKMAVDTTPLNHLDRNDAQMKYDDTTWGYGANVGVIFEPKPDTRVGLTYTSEIDLDFEDRINIEGGGALLNSVDDTKTKLDMTVPQTLTLSLFQKISDRWAFLASTNWQDWSAFGEVYADVDTNGGNSASTTLDAKFKDTWHLSIGTQYQVSEKTLWNAGVAYDSSMVSDKNRLIMLPVQQEWQFGTGVTYAVRKDMDINVSWNVSLAGDVEAVQTKALSGATTSGNFKSAWVQTLGGSATWHF